MLPIAFDAWPREGENWGDASFHRLDPVEAGSPTELVEALSAAAPPGTIALMDFDVRLGPPHRATATAIVAKKVQS